MRKTKLDLQIEAKESGEALMLQASRLAGIAQAYRESDGMLSIDLQGIEAHLRQVANRLLCVEPETETAPEGKET